MSTKKAVIVVELGFESTQTSNTQIERKSKEKPKSHGAKKSEESTFTTANEGGCLGGYLAPNAAKT